MNDWDPAHYGQYADERARPYGDLVRRIGAERPRRVVDLGCGSGELTASLARIWPTAEIVGVDSSPAMIEKARTIKVSMISVSWNGTCATGAPTTAPTC